MKSKSKSEESILVVPRSVLEPFIQFRGFRSLSNFDLSAWMEHSGFQPRGKMENDPAYKQLIPYILIRSGEQVFRYWRTKNAGEERLHHLYSLGVGGHINHLDESLFDEAESILQEAAWRELDEEVELSIRPELRPIGLINDDETEVGKVHLGIVYEVWLPSPEARIRENALARGEWKPVRDLDDVKYETWSQFLVEHYLK